MGIKRIISAILLSCLLIAFSACVKDAGSNEFMTNASHVFVTSTSPNSFSFNLALFTKEPIGKVECLGLEGESINSSDYSVSVIDNNTDLLNNYSYKGWHIKYCMIEITAAEGVERCSFERIVLNIDGTAQKVSFTRPIEHVYSEGNVFSDVLRISVFPNEFPSSFINDESQSAVFEFYAVEDISLNGIRFDDHLQASEAVYSIDNSEPIRAEFPIELKKGQTIRIALSLGSDTLGHADYVITNVYFEFTKAFDNARSRCGGVVVFDPIYPIMGSDVSGIDSMIDTILSER